MQILCLMSHHMLKGPITWKENDETQVIVALLIFFHLQKQLKRNIQTEGIK